MFLAASDIDSVPADVLKYILITLGWLATTGAAIYGGARWSKRGSKESPVSIEQPLDVRKHDAPAKKSEHDSLRALVLSLDNKITEALISKGGDALTLSQMLAKLKEDLSVAGDARAEKITNKIDAEVRSSRADTERKVAELRSAISAVQMSSAAHAAQIEDLKARDHSHDTQLLMLRNAGGKPR